MNTVANDRVMVEKSKAGDHAAFAELLHQNSPTARRTIRAITRNPADVDDVMQDTLAIRAVAIRDERRLGIEPVRHLTAGTVTDVLLAHNDFS